MPADRAFFDTNILIYAFSNGDSRQNTALSLLLAGGIVSIQSLNEFASVSSGKLRKPWSEVVSRLGTIQQLCDPPIPMTLAVHHRGLQIAQVSGYHLYDSLLLAAAIEASCTIFYSEDMQDGHMIDTLTIQNPFRRKKLH